MYPGVKPEDYVHYLHEADDHLDNLSGERLEDILRRVITEYCKIPCLAQGEINWIISNLPHFIDSPPLDAVYAAQTLLRTRWAIADLLAGCDATIANNAMLENMTKYGSDNLWKPGEDCTVEENDPVDVIYSSRNNKDDIFNSVLRQHMIEFDSNNTTDETPLELSDTPDSLTCFRLATRHLAVGIIDTCTGQQSPNKYRPLVPVKFPRMNPLFITGLSSKSTMTAIACGLIADMTTLQLSEDGDRDYSSEE